MKSHEPSELRSTMTLKQETQNNIHLYKQIIFKFQSTKDKNDLVRNGLENELVGKCRLALKWDKRRTDR